MRGANTKVDLVLPEDFDELFALEMHMRGYITETRARKAGGDVYPITFYQPARVYTELMGQTRDGHYPCWLEDIPVGLLPEITLEQMRAAVEYLDVSGFFEHLVSWNPGALQQHNVHPSRAAHVS
jgi:hypothetical protein